MRTHSAWLLALGCALLGGCSNEKPAPAPQAEVLPPSITQFYAPQPTISAGETAKLCYGVENAKSVWISPPLKELSVALARCIEVEPKENTTYALTVEGSDGNRVSRELMVFVGAPKAPKAKIINVNVSAVDVKAGDTVSVCYQVEHVRSVTIDPPGYRGGANPKGCVTDQPRKTTTYVIAALGADGDRDTEQVTVRVH
jgi:hypothetical protein